MDKLITLQYRDTDDGFCRVYYTYTNAEGHKTLYCWQEEFTGVFVFHTCTDWPEPLYAITPKANIRFERPGAGESNFGERLAAWLEAKGILVEQGA